LNPLDIWQETGRAEDFGDELFRLKDRKGRDMCLAPTHEEVVCAVARNEIRSYKDLPQIWYQIQNKFRDEPRPRSGVLRTRQFIMKDSYTLDASEEGLDAAYNKHAQAYRNIFSRCGLKFFVVGASSGLMGGSASQEFMLESDVGEDTCAVCDKCGYAANVEVAKFRVQPIPDPGETQLEEVHTPEKRTVEEVSDFLGLPRSHFIKTLLYIVDSKPVMLLLRGDYDLNESKMMARFGAKFRPATDEEIRQVCGANPGFIGPVGIKNVPIYADNTIRGQRGFVSGANKDQYHIKGIDPQRDVAITEYVDIAQVKDGDLCPECGSPLRVVRAIELGHIFKLGTKYSTSMGATFLDADGKQKPIIMGSYGIGVERIIAAFIEQTADEKGIVWNKALAPFYVHIVPINYKSEKVRSAADKLYEELNEAGIDTIIDDRDFSPGFKFRDADLLGMPVQLIIGEKNLDKNQVELKLRKTDERSIVPLDQCVTEISKILDQLD
ncbi:MAG TPA: proline--tRNA ligase, partial [Bacteroidetes bacterium]|nr:proline--tRNA ligase [Bacteroidota bacterium]